MGCVLGELQETVGVPTEIACAAVKNCEDAAAVVGRERRERPDGRAAASAALAAGGVGKRTILQMSETLGKAEGELVALRRGC